MFPFLNTGRTYPHLGPMLLTPRDTILSTGPKVWELKGTLSKNGKDFELVYIPGSPWVPRCAGLVIEESVLGNSLVKFQDSSRMSSNSCDARHKIR